MIEPNSRVRVVKDVAVSDSPYIGKEGNALSSIRGGGWYVLLDGENEALFFRLEELEPVSTKARRILMGRVEQYDGPFGEPQIDGVNVTAMILEFLGRNVRLTVEEVDG